MSSNKMAKINQTHTSGLPPRAVAHYNPVLHLAPNHNTVSIQGTVGHIPRVVGSYISDEYVPDSIRERKDVYTTDMATAKHIFNFQPRENTGTSQ